MTIDYTALADAINSGESAEQAFIRLSALTATSDKDIQTADIKAYLTLVDKRLAVEEATTDNAKKARLAFADFESFRLTDSIKGAAYKMRLEAVLDGLITDNLLDANDKTAIMAIGAESKPVWHNLKQGHVDNAIEWRAEGKV